MSWGWQPETWLCAILRASSAHPSDQWEHCPSLLWILGVWAGHARTRSARGALPYRQRQTAPPRQYLPPALEPLIEQKSSTHCEAEPGFCLILLRSPLTVSLGGWLLREVYLCPVMVRPLEAGPGIQFPPSCPPHGLRQR